MHHSRMLHFLSSRGSRRLEEKKKYKCIGEINMLTKMLDEVKQNQKNIEYEQRQTAKQKKIKENQVKDSMGLLDGPTTPMSRNSTGKNELVMTSARSSSRNRGRKHSPTASARDAEPNPLPTSDSLFNRIYTEFDKLRNCGMSRRDFIQLVDKKEHKSLSVKAIAYWNGVLAGLKVGD